MMKKIMAGAVAAILAVSTLATAALAKDVDLAGTATQKNATVTKSYTTTVTATGTDITVALADTATSTIVSATVKATVLATNTDVPDAKKSQEVTKTLDKAGTAKFTTTAGTGFTDFTFVKASDAVKIDITATVKSATAYTKDTTAGLTVALTNTGADDAAAEVAVTAVNDDTTVAGALTAGALKVTKEDAKAAAAAGEDAIITLTFKDKFAAATALTATYLAAGVTDATKTTNVAAMAAKDATTVTFAIPAADLYKAAAIVDGELVAGGSIGTIAVAGFGGNTLTAAAITYADDADASVDEPVDPDATDADDTDAADTDAADDKTDGKGDNTETGVVLAVVPAIIAGAAIVVSRKRK